MFSNTGEKRRNVCFPANLPLKKNKPKDDLNEIKHWPGTVSKSNYSCGYYGHFNPSMSSQVIVIN